jgi:hypothetical protein
MTVRWCRFGGHQEAYNLVQRSIASAWRPRMAKKEKTRRVYDEDFKREAVQMLLDGHSAKSAAERCLHAKGKWSCWPNRYGTRNNTWSIRTRRRQPSPPYQIAWNRCGCKQNGRSNLPHKSSCIAPLPARLAGSRGWHARHNVQLAKPPGLNLCSPLEAACTS